MKNVVLNKSTDFAKRIVRLYKHLCKEHKEFILAKQILRSGTSIGANIIEAQGGASKKDFLYKIQIAHKECLETAYWLELLYAGEYITEEEYSSINLDCSELLKLLSSIVITTKENLQKN